MQIIRQYALQECQISIAIETTRQYSISPLNSSWQRQNLDVEDKLIEPFDKSGDKNLPLTIRRKSATFVQKDNDYEYDTQIY